MKQKPNCCITEVAFVVSHWSHRLRSDRSSGEARKYWRFKGKVKKALYNTKQKIRSWRSFEKVWKSKRSSGKSEKMRKWRVQRSKESRWWSRSVSWSNGGSGWLLIPLLLQVAWEVTPVRHSVIHQELVTGKCAQGHRFCPSKDGTWGGKQRKWFMCIIKRQREVNIKEKNITVSWLYAWRRRKYFNASCHDKNGNQYFWYH